MRFDSDNETGASPRVLEALTRAVAALGCAPADISWKAGVDVLCLGATKNGALAAEAVVFFKRDLAASFIHKRKRSGHLLSKGRFFGAQFASWLEKGHWLELARHANELFAVVRFVASFLSTEQVSVDKFLAAARALPKG